VRGVSIAYAIACESDKAKATRNNGIGVSYRHRVWHHGMATIIAFAQTIMAALARRGAMRGLSGVRRHRTTAA
jgi:ureidoglycolate hydrolase